MTLVMSFSLIFVSILTAITQNSASMASSDAVDISVNVNSKLVQQNENVIGVNQLPTSNKALTLMKSIGVKWVRIDASLEGSINGVPVYNCLNGNWNPAIVAPRVAAAQNISANSELIIDYSPTCLAETPTSNPQYSPPDSPSTQSKWTALIFKVGMWAIAHHVTTFEVWNEPDWVFWSGGLTGYLQLYKDTALALEKASQASHVTVAVGGPALANVGGTMDTIWLDSFLQYVNTNHLPLNFLSWHTYAEDPNAGPSSNLPSFCFSKTKNPPNIPCYYTQQLNTAVYGDEVQQAKVALKPFPNLQPVLWIDEWNINGEFDARDNTSFAAAFILSAIDSATSNGIGRMSWYNVLDSNNDPLAAFGLLDYNFSKKPSYNSFYLYHELAGSMLSQSISYYASVQNNPFGTQGGVGSFSAKTPDGIVHVLIYNFIPYDPTGNFGSHTSNNFKASIALSFSGLKSGTYNAGFQTIQSTSSGKIVQSSAILNSANPRLNILLNEDGVELVTLTPQSKSQSTQRKFIILVVVLVILLLILSVLFVVHKKQMIKA